MNQDPFSHILTLVNARSVVAGGFSAGGDWAIAFPPPDRVKFFIAARGACWLAMEGGDAPIRLREGDVFLMAAARAFTLASDLSLPAQNAGHLFAHVSRKIINIGVGDEFLFLGGHVQLDSAGGQLLINNLPPAIHLRAGRAEATALQWLIDQLVHEHSAGLPGSDFASAQLAQLMFLQILRGYLATTDALMAGRLRAISDPRIAPAIRLMHDDPAQARHLTDLAQACAMSRTAFAIYFKSVAGVAPLTYLTQWRMHLAERTLREGNASLATLAASLGYSSESAFSIAFKRVTGRAPQHYRSVMRKASGQPDPGPAAGI